jgi:hypothetical protein
MTQVPGGGHLLIVPITHYPTFSTIPSDIAKAAIDETERCVCVPPPCTRDHKLTTTCTNFFVRPIGSYKAALRSMYAKYGAAAVVFEVGRLSAKGGHAHV